MSEADTDLRGLSWRGSDSDLQVKKASAPPQVHLLVPVSQTLAAAPEAKEDQQPPRSAQTIHLRKKPVWGMIQRRHTQEEHRTSKCKLDLKVRRQFSPFWFYLSVLHRLQVFSSL